MADFGISVDLRCPIGSSVVFAATDAQSKELLQILGAIYNPPADLAVPRASTEVPPLPKRLWPDTDSRRCGIVVVAKH